MQCLKEFVSLFNWQTQIIKGITRSPKSSPLLDFSGNML